MYTGRPARRADLGAHRRHKRGERPTGSQLSLHDLPWRTHPSSSSGSSSHRVPTPWQKKIFVHAGCPEKGRVGDLHVFDLTTKSWSELASAPEPARGGTALAAVHLNGTPVLFRFGGWCPSFCLHVLVSSEHIANAIPNLGRFCGRRA